MGLGARQTGTTALPLIQSMTLTSFKFSESQLLYKIVVNNNVLNKKEGI